MELNEAVCACIELCYQLLQYEIPSKELFDGEFLQQLVKQTLQKARKCSSITGQSNPRQLVNRFQKYGNQMVVSEECLGLSNELQLESEIQMRSEEYRNQSVCLLLSDQDIASMVWIPMNFLKAKKIMIFCPPGKVKWIKSIDNTITFLSKVLQHSQVNLWTISCFKKEKKNALFQTVESHQLDHHDLDYQERDHHDLDHQESDHHDLDHHKLDKENRVDGTKTTFKLLSPEKLPPSISHIHESLETYQPEITLPSSIMKLNLLNHEDLLHLRKSDSTESEEQNRADPFSKTLSLSSPFSTLKTTATEIEQKRTIPQSTETNRLSSTLKSTEKEKEPTKINLKKKENDLEKEDDAEKNLDFIQQQDSSLASSKESFYGFQMKFKVESPRVPSKRYTHEKTLFSHTKTPISKEMLLDKNEETMDIQSLISQSKSVKSMDLHLNACNSPIVGKGTPQKSLNPSFKVQSLRRPHTASKVATSFHHSFSKLLNKIDIEKDIRKGNDNQNEIDNEDLLENSGYHENQEGLEDHGIQDRMRSPKTSSSSSSSTTTTENHLNQRLFPKKNKNPQFSVVQSFAGSLKAKESNKNATLNRSCKEFYTHDSHQNKPPKDKLKIKRPIESVALSTTCIVKEREHHPIRSHQYQIGEFKLKSQQQQQQQQQQQGLSLQRSLISYELPPESPKESSPECQKESKSLWKVKVNGDSNEENFDTFGSNFLEKCSNNWSIKEENDNLIRQRMNKESPDPTTMSDKMIKEIESTTNKIKNSLDNILYKEQQENEEEPSHMKVVEESPDPRRVFQNVHCNESLDDVEDKEEIETQWIRKSIPSNSSPSDSNPSDSIPSDSSPSDIIKLGLVEEDVVVVEPSRDLLFSSSSSMNNYVKSNVYDEKWNVCLRPQSGEEVPITSVEKKNLMVDQPQRKEKCQQYPIVLKEKIISKALSYQLEGIKHHIEYESQQKESMKKLKKTQAIQEALKYILSKGKTTLTEHKEVLYVTNNTKENIVDKTNERRMSFKVIKTENQHTLVDTDCDSLDEDDRIEDPKNDPNDNQNEDQNRMIPPTTLKNDISMILPTTLKNDKSIVKKSVGEEEDRIHSFDERSIPYVKSLTTDCFLENEPRYSKIPQLETITIANVANVANVADVGREDHESKLVRLEALREKKVRQMEARLLARQQRLQSKRSQQSVEEGTIKEEQESKLQESKYPLYNGASNRQLIRNAVEYNLLAGTHLMQEKEDALKALDSSNSENFIVLFRGEKAMKFRGLYSFNPNSNQVFKIYGIGPQILRESIIKQFYRYNSGRKAFVSVPTRSFTVKTDAGAVDESFFRKQTTTSEQ